MPITPIRHAKVSDQVADALRDAILGGEFHSGALLPPERELADRFRVNRSSVREAVLRLQGWGLVDTRHGGGTRVLDVLAAAGLQVLPFLLMAGGRLDPVLLRDLLELRQALLSYTGSRAARAATPAGLDALRQALGALESATDPRDRQQRDWDFFEALVAASGNRVLALLANAIRPVYERHLDLFAAIAPIDSHWHRAAVDAIAEGDATAAGRAMFLYAGTPLERTP